MYLGRILIFLLAAELGSCLTLLELAQFKSRVYTESNTGVQGYVRLLDTNLSTYEIQSNGIPDHKTGKAASKIEAQSYSIKLPTTPVFASATTCLPDGPIGMAINGVPIFNSYSHDCCDKGKKQLANLDECWGLVDDLGRYHYTLTPACLFKLTCNNPSQLIGVAFDGFPIYGPNDETGRRITKADLDACNGRYNRYRKYRYHITTEFPYTIGCFKGVPVPGYAGTCLCSNLTEPCPNQQPPNPSTPPSRRRRSVDTGITSLTCCASANNCDHLYNDRSSANTAKTTLSFLLFTFTTALAFIL
ncbi:uncharacterized protein LOC144749685 isoform X1 [Ciona intestinalis]